MSNEPITFDAGYFYCPYMPMVNPPVIDNQPVTIDPEVFLPQKGILTRYGKKLLAEGARYYSRLAVSDFVPPAETEESIWEGVW